MKSVSFIVSFIFLANNALCSNIATISNYFVDKYEENTGEFTLYYPYPIGLCVQTGIYSYDYAIYTCSDDSSTVTKTIYSDIDCINQVGSSITFDSSDIKSNGIYDFNCGGLNNYVTIQVCIGGQQIPSSPDTDTDTDNDEDEDDSGFVCESTPNDNQCILTGIATWATDICHYAGNGTTSERMLSDCDENDAYINYYANSDDTCEIAANELELSLQCDYFGRIRTSLGRAYVYAFMTNCVQEGVELVPQPTILPSLAPTVSSGSGNDQGNSNGGATGNSSDSSGSISDTSAVIAIICILFVLCVIVGISYWLNKKRSKHVKSTKVGYVRRLSDISVTGQSTNGINNTNNDNNYNDNGMTAGNTDGGMNDGALPMNTNDELLEAEPSISGDDENEMYENENENENHSNVNDGPMTTTAATSTTVFVTKGNDNNDTSMAMPQQEATNDGATNSNLGEN